MGVLSDWLIKRNIKIEPFAEGAVRPGVISYGVSSYGYDVRVGRMFKVFTNVYGAVVDPKNFDSNAFVHIEGDHCLIPPNSFALAETVEYLEIPRDILAICVGKCVTGDTRVIDADTGDYVPIRDFVARQAGQTVALDRYRLRPAQVTDHRDNGIEPVYRLCTWAGQSIRATAAHPFLTIEGWKPLHELQPGERIATARSCPHLGKEEWPEHEAHLLGLLLADGQCRTPQHSPRYTTGDSRLVEVFTAAAHQFGCDVSPVGTCGYNLVNRRGRGGIMTHNRAYLWLKSLGCACKSIHKSVPAVVFRARRPSVAAFLRALYSGDGSSDTSRSRKGTMGMTLEYASSSEQLTRDVRHLLLRFGIFSLIRSRKSASGRTAYRVQISDLEMLHLFAEQIGFIPGSKKDAAFRANLAALGNQAKQRSNFDTLPHQVWEMLAQAARAQGRSLLSLGWKRRRGLSAPLAAAQTVACATRSAHLAELAAGDVVWDRVESIEPAGMETVFDLTVPGPASFLANDLLVHNSTYARCGIIVNVTPLEPEWRGKITIEISNTTPLPAKIYAGEGIAQIVFHRAEAVCKVSYGDKKGKYQDQKGLTLPFVQGEEPAD